MKSSILGMAIAAFMAASSFALAQDSAVTNTDGQTIDTDMIVGGKPAAADKWPWQVRLFDGSDDRRGFCGGSLINRTWVLTAAHCVDDKKKIQVGFGNNDVEKLTRIRSSKIIVHRSYDPNTNANDIALIKLSTKVKFNKGASSINLGSRDLYGGLDRKAVWVTGWGLLVDPAEIEKRHPNGDIPWGRYTPRKLHEVSVVVQPLAKCQENYSGGIPDGQMCAGFDRGGKDSCNGDSGGPLVVQNKKRWVQVGVVSWGAGCAQPHLYGVYTRADYYANWINRTIENN